MARFSVRATASRRRNGGTRKTGHAGLPCVLIVYRRGSRETHYGPKLLIHLIKPILVLNCAARTKIFILLRSCEGIARGRAGREPTGGRSKAVGQNGLGRRPG